MAQKPTQTGSVAYGFHEGARTEYLAQYVFTTFGTSVPVPRPEDHGVDLYCTLAEPQGNLVWPVAYYSVQVKSTAEILVYPSPESVKWVVDYPAPLLYCIIRKSDGRVRIYQTIARFAAAVAPELPTRMSLVPAEPVPAGPDKPAEYAPARTWEPGCASGSHSLGPPILDFKVQELLDDVRFEQIRAVLDFWVRLDFDNIRRYQMGMRQVQWPGQHTTNKVPASSNARYFLWYAPPQIRAKAEATASELLDWLARVRLSDHEYLGALLAALMLRHSDPEAERFPWDVLSELRGVTGLDAATKTDRVEYVASPFDKLLAQLGEKVQALAQPTPAVATDTPAETDGS